LRTGNNIVRGSSIQTPYFWTSTLVTELSRTNSTLSTNTSIGAFNATLYPLYDSVYNIFGDRQSFGSPIPPTIYPAYMDVTTNSKISTVSTTSGIIFSTMYTVQGSFAFLPNEDVHPFKIEWNGNLSLNINGSNYGTASTIAYPRPQTFTMSTISTTILQGPVCQVSFTYLKQNASDYISFSNMTDYIYGTDSFAIARMYPAYGYNMSDTPLLTQTITGLPIGFSTFSNVGPYLALSTYVLVASTFYQTGCNTMFPISSLGFTSLSFNETTTSKTAVGFRQNLATSNTGYLSTIISASNAFGYDFTTYMPNSPYSLQLVFGKRQPQESLFISSLYKMEISYDYAYATFASTLFYASSISSYNGYFVNLNIKDFNITNLTISTLYASSISTGQGLFYNINVSSINNSNLASLGGANTSSTFSTLATYLNTVNSTINVNLSSFSTVPLIPALVTYINQVNSTINKNLSTFSTATLPSGGGGSDASTISTLYTNILLLTSSLSGNTNSFSSSVQPSGGGGSDASTISTLYTNIVLLTSTLSGDTSGFSTTWTPPGELYTSTLYASSITLANVRQPFVQYGVGSILPADTGVPLPKSYTNTYAIQLTYSNLTQPINTLFASNVRASSFYVTGDVGNTFYWTTFGQIM